MTRHESLRWGKLAIRGGGFVTLFWGSAVCAGEHPGVPPAVSPSTGALTLDLKVLPLTLQDVVYLALLNNRDVKIERLNPEVAATGVSQARAVFDPSLSMEATTGHAETGEGNLLSGSPTPASDSINWSAGLKARLISGAMASLDFKNSRTESNSTFLTLNPQYTSSLLFTLTQPLLREFGPSVNTIRIKVARNNATMSRYLLQSRIAGVLANAETSYWDLVLGFKERDIRRKALGLAQRLVDRTRGLVQEGLLPEIALLQAETSLEQRGSELKAATNALADAIGRLQDALNLDSTADVQIVPLDQPTLDAPAIHLEQVVKDALARRPELSQVKLDLKNWNLQAELAKNQMLPQLNLLFSYGWTGVAGESTSVLDLLENHPTAQQFFAQRATQASQSSLEGGYGQALENLVAGANPSWKVGFNFTMPLGNVAAKSELSKASVEVRKASLTVRDVERKITVEVERAARQVQTSRTTVDGTRALRQQTERRLEMAQEQFDSGLAPMSAVLEAQQDLATGEREEWRAIVDYNKTLVLFDKAIGATLDKYGVTF
ncbi:MAG: hypothetical protein A2Z17_01340 [Gammaproteobacteria bacterium RBG_16_66_13]|nr:MAG: hypothetical protein A2Z17_01340 [Gammaproteobacteria bacterium RBG_16_66_13]